MKNKVYITSALIGISAGFVTIQLFSMLGTELANIVMMCILNVVPTSILLMLLLLLKKFPTHWESMKIRIVCITIFLIAYTYFFTAALTSMIADEFMLHLALPLTFLIILFGIPFLLAILPNFLSLPIKELACSFAILSFSTIITAVIAYITTLGIKSTPRRIIYAILLALFIYSAAASYIPLIGLAD